MISEQIEKLKADYTDKYVMVDSDRPELARFGGYVGQVKTVNMSGRALVEFHEYLENIGWYDIELDYLRVVDKPQPKKKEPAKKPPAAKKAAPSQPQDGGEKKLSPLEMARMQGPAKKPDAPKPPKQAAEKMSVDDILAAARGEKSSHKAPPAESVPSAKQETKPDRSKMSVADILAAARAEKGAAPASKTPEPPDDSGDAPPAAAEPSVAEADSTADAPQESPATPEPDVDRSSMSVDDILAWCRTHDGGS